LTAEEEKGHRHMLLELYEQRFGLNLPPIRREDVKGFLRRRPIWLTRNLPLDTIRKEAEIMELEAERFYAKAAEQAQDVGVRGRSGRFPISPYLVAPTECWLHRQIPCIGLSTHFRAGMLEGLKLDERLADTQATC
jgi:Rubrerythrin